MTCCGRSHQWPPGGGGTGPARSPPTALATVVDGGTPAVFRMLPGDPHPFGWIRVQFNAALCRSWFGPGPWDRMARVWARRHPLGRAEPEAAEVAAQTLP